MSTETSIINPLQNDEPWSMDIETTELAVTVENGVLALTGRVRCCIRPGELSSEEPRIAHVPEEALEVRAPFAFKRTDIEIACDAATAVRRTLPCSCECVRLVVKDGWLTLEGDLEWNYQRARIVQAVMPMIGITGIDDRTRLCSQRDPALIREKIEAAQCGRSIAQR